MRQKLLTKQKNLASRIEHYKVKAFCLFCVWVTYFIPRPGLLFLSNIITPTILCIQLNYTSHTRWCSMKLYSLWDIVTSSVCIIISRNGHLDKVNIPRQCLKKGTSWATILLRKLDQVTPDSWTKISNNKVFNRHRNLICQIFRFAKTNLAVSVKREKCYLLSNANNSE